MVNDGFKCLECGRKFRSGRAAESAAMNGCPGCGGVDIDLDVDVDEQPTPNGMGASQEPADYGPGDIGDGCQVEKPTLILVGEDGNAFSILGRARKVARRAGWSDAEWEKVWLEATSSDYDHLLQTMMRHFDAR